VLHTKKHFCTKIAKVNGKTSVVYYSSVLPYTWVIFFQIPTIKNSRKVLTLQCLQHIRISSDYLHNRIWSFPTRIPLSKLMILGTNKQNCLPNQFAYLKRLQFYLLIISSSNSDFLLLNFFQSLQPLVGNLINVIHHQIMIIDSRHVILLSQPTGSQIHLHG
jgi:hypothetical protein